MVAPVAVSERDLRTLLGIVNDDHSDDPEAGLPVSLLSDLMSVVRCDQASFFGLDSAQQAAWFMQEVPATDGGDAAVFWVHYWDCVPCCYPDRGGDLRRAMRISDFYSGRQWRSTGMYQDYFRPLGFEHELMLCLPARPRPAAGPGPTIRLILFRGPGPDFSERDCGLMELLRPHLHQAYLDAQRRRSAVLQLTPRQLELLRLVAAGYTNGQIARRLGLSEGTVRIHLQNIYGRLQVSSRTAAVTRAFPDLATM